MKQNRNCKISLAEHTLIGKTIVAQMPVITFAEALLQTQGLRKTSAISEQLKKSRQKV